MEDFNSKYTGEEVESLLDQVALGGGGGGTIDLSQYAKKEELADVATSGSYNDLSDKPAIPSAVTESIVSGWGFTKNTGTYSKPSIGIPESDLTSDVQNALDKAKTALQEHQSLEEYATKDYVTSVLEQSIYVALNTEV